MTRKGEGVIFGFLSHDIHPPSPLREARGFFSL